MTKEHSHAKILRMIANGEQLQFRGSVDYTAWIDATHSQCLLQIGQDADPNLFRVKPTIILINGFEVPEPVTSPLALGQEYWVVDLDGVSKPSNYWQNDSFDNGHLKNGLIHLDYASAVTHTNALLSFTKK